MPLGSLEQPSRTTLATRKGVAWGLEAPIEDSSVLVIGAPSKWYIDIRFALEGPSTEGPFWAFAGQAKYSPLASGSTADNGLSPGWGEAMRGEWAHPIDSMGNVEGIDRADVFTLPNGDQVEFGTLEHPETGQMSLFKEYWTKPENAENSETYARAMFEEDGQVKGVIIRVGKWMQGIRQVSGQTVEVGRWRLQGSWIADQYSPSGSEEVFPWLWLSEEHQNGEVHECAGRQWRLVESSSS